MALFDKLRKRTRPEPTVQQYMMLRVCGEGKRVQYSLSSYSTKEIEWISPEVDADGNPLKVRKPEEVTQVFREGTPFMATGKIYANCMQICTGQDDSGIRRTDSYGREVLYMKERFPCFDSYDYLYEDRYYHWFLIRTKNCLTRIFYTDKRSEIYVTEDVGNLESRLVEEMMKIGYIQ